MFPQQLKHPSAFGKFEEMAELTTGKCVAVFLDYDGTLSPIVDDPERAFLSDEVTIYIYIPLTTFREFILYSNYEKWV